VVEKYVHVAFDETDFQLQGEGISVDNFVGFMTSEILDEASFNNEHCFVGMQDELNQFQRNQF